MSVFLGYVVLGVVLGAIYFIAASGLVVTYATSGVFNFANGAVGMVAAFCYWALHTSAGWPALPALLLIVLVGGPAVGALLEAGLMRRLRGAPVLSTISVTIGLMLALVGLGMLVWNENSQQTRLLSGFFSATSSFGVFGAYVTYDQLMIFIVAVAVAAGIWALLHHTRLGVAMRAVVDDPELLALSGVSPGGAARAGWMIGSSLAALAGVLLVDSTAGTNLDIITITLLVVSCYSAAVFGRLRSLPLTFAGAVVLGVGINLAIGYLPQGWQQSGGVLQNPEATLPMVFLFVVLLLLPERRQRTAERVPAVRLPVASLPTSLMGAALLIAAGVLASRLLPGNDVTLLASGVAFALIGLSLVPLTGYAGQISCCQLTFAGIGAFVMAHTLGDDSPVGLLLAVVVSAVVGAIIALPSLRFRGLYLALSTLAFASAMDSGFFGSTHFASFGGVLNIGRAPIFGLQFGSDRAYLVLLVVVYALAAVGVLALRRSRFGRRLVAISDSSVAASMASVKVATTKLIVFAGSAALAGLGGALLAGVTFVAQPTDYQMLFSLSLLLLVTVWGVRSVSGVLVAGLGFYLVPYWLNSNYSWLYLLTGLGAIGISRNPEGVIGDLLSRFGRGGGLQVAGRLSKLSPARASSSAGAAAVVAGAGGGTVAVEADA
jgi:branched-chain amino acid transport system permease protein